MDSVSSSSKNAKWYVAHTYSGYENKVKTNLEKIIENRNLENLILDVRVPTEDVIETKGEEKKVMTDDTWYIIRNTTGVTGFVGPGSKPVPLTEQEVEALGVEVREIVASYNIGDNVKIIEGAFVNQMGKVESINNQTKKVTVSVSMFGRQTSLELDINHVESV